MKFSKTYTYVLFSVLLLSSTVISDRVSSLPLTIVEELKSNSMDGYSNYDDVLRLVPTGPNPMKSPGIPPTPPLSESLYGFEHFDDILRRVPKGTNPAESPPLNVLHSVPSGPNPIHNPGIPLTPPTSELLCDSSTFKGFKVKTLNNDDILRCMPKSANPPESLLLNVLRTVPSGPDPKHHEEISPTPPASELLRHVPKCLN
ncbi:hypothetical protein M0R45_018899 [Rubus argutus]|uniref:Uncharacterized protein n=1 Tax=Rubus argutus TaxID=59490 RepID=A0AAW1X4A3_RUBAR